MGLNKVIACLKELKLKPKIDSFENRLIIQKIIYLLELKGIKFSFNYNLYVRGPYSPSLAKEIYANKTEVEKLNTDSKLNKIDLKRIGEFMELFSELKPSILEIASTYSYFAFEQKQNPIIALKNTKEFKSFYSEVQIAVGISKAKEFLFVPTKKELNEMKKEAKLWQNASIKSMS